MLCKAPAYGHGSRIDDIQYQFLAEYTRRHRVPLKYQEWQRILGSNASNVSQEAMSLGAYIYTHSITIVALDIPLDNLERTRWTANVVGGITDSVVKG